MVSHEQQQPLPYSDGSIPAAHDRVAVLDSELDGYPKSVQAKIKGRIGIVKCLTYPSATPVVIYPAQGRKKEFYFGQVRSKWLRLVARADQTE